MANTSQGLDVGKMALEGFGQVMDSMDLVKRAWSNFSLTTPFTPTLSVEELDKRITELRAVEQWLALNQNMLRNTIQGLEVQRGTLDAISTMSKSFGKMTKPADDAMAQAVARFAAAAAQKAAASPPEPAPEAGAPAGGAFDWSPFAMPSSVFNRPTPAARTAEANPPTAGAKAAAAEPDADDPEGFETNGAVPDLQEDSPDDREAEATGPAPGDAASRDRVTASPTSAMNPMAWWDMLQANFRQIAQVAAGDAQASGGSKEAGGEGTRRRTSRGADEKSAGSKARGTGATGKAASTGKAADGKSARGKLAGSKSAGGRSAPTRTDTATPRRTRRSKGGGVGEPE